MDNSLAEVLKFCEEAGIIDINDVRKKMQKKKREELLAKHPYSIYETKDGRWRTYLPDETKEYKRRLISRKSRKKLEDEIIDYYKSQDESEIRSGITLASLYPEWLEFKRKHTKAETYIARIDIDWRKYYANTDMIEKPIIELTKIELDEWAHILIKHNNMSKNQYYNATIIIRQVLEYAVDKNIIEENLFSKIKIDGKRLFRKVKKKPDNTQVFNKTELLEMEKLAWHDFNNQTKLYELVPLAILFQFQTGIRLGELCVIRYEDIEGDYIHIQRMYRPMTKEIVEHTKTEAGDRKIILTNKAKMLIETAKKHQQKSNLDSDGYIFSVNAKLTPPAPIEKAYRKYCKKLGICQKSSHKTRKTVISALIDGGVNINTIRVMVGHEDERTTYGNYAFDRKTDKEKKKLVETALST